MRRSAGWIEVGGLIGLWLAASGCGPCAPKAPEKEDITITLQTPKPSVPAPATQGGPEKARPEYERGEVGRLREELRALRPRPEPTPPARTAQEPPAPPPSAAAPAAAGTVQDEAEIRAIINRQMRAVNTRDEALYFADYYKVLDRDRQAWKDMTSKYDELQVDFDVQSITIKGPQATATMIQSTRLRAGIRTGETRALVTWQFLKVHGKWKLAGTEAQPQ